MATDSTTAAYITAAVKRKLNITWVDADTDARVADVIGIVSPALAHAIGEDSYAFTTSDGEELGLLVNACFYEFNNALDDFWTNYAPEIQRCRIKHIVAALGDGAGA